MDNCECKNANIQGTRVVILLEGNQRDKKKRERVCLENMRMWRPKFLTLLVPN